MTEPSILGHARGFARAAIAPLWRVLQAGNDPNQPDSGSGIVVQPIQAATDPSGNTGASTTWYPGSPSAGGSQLIVAGNGASGHSGGELFMASGTGDAGAHAGAAYIALPGTTTADGRVAISSDNSFGNAGDVLTADGGGGISGARWQPPSGGGPSFVASQAFNFDYSGNLFSPIPDNGHTYSVVGEITADTNGYTSTDIYSGTAIVNVFRTPFPAPAPTGLRVFASEFDTDGVGTFGASLASYFRVPAGAGAQQLAAIYQPSGGAGDATAGQWTAYLLDWGVLIP